jgi:hypothetical protein
MVKEVFSNEVPRLLKPPKREGAPKTVEIYSAIATVDNTLLLKDRKRGELPEGDPLENINEKFKGKDITLIRTILPDRELATKLVEELELRRVDLKDGKTHLVLVAEWDTYYGRSFHGAFRSALIKKDVSSVEIDQRVHRISYLRGIDGSLPGEKEDKKDEKAEARSDPSKEIKNLEQPIGKSQYDYLRRLAEETYDLDHDLKANGKGQIKAIGVMGTDFYDKYLVLQALRQRFPDVIFFTTDLDARFLHPDNIKWTRNLVVASNFGLSLRKDHDVDIQGEVPPFRDNYQTSVFLAVLLAFSDRPYLDWTLKELIRQPLQPLVFEIGRHKAILLTDSKETVHPSKHQVGGKIWFYIRIAFIIIFGFIFLFYTSARVNDYVRKLARAGKRYKIVAVISVSFMIAFVVAIDLISNLEKEEPFSIFEGISVWPTEIFRFIAILLSLLFLYWSWRSRKGNREDIDKEFHFMEEAQSSSGVNHSATGKWGAVLNWIKNVARLDWTPRESKQKTTLNRLWNEYVHFDSEKYHVRRVTIIAIFYLLLCGLIISFDMPVRPLRGRITFGMNIGVLSVSTILFAVLISYVFDVTRCCRKFITTASDECSKESYDLPDAPIRVQIDNQLTLIRLIAMRTDTVGKLIFYPFIVWLVMFVSRFDYFDNWRTPLGLAVVISLGALYAWSCAFLLRQSAERARTCAVDRLKRLKSDVLASETPSQDLIKYTDFVLDEVRSIRQGAFAPFTQHPVVQSLLVPFGGVGGIYLIEFLTKMNI